MRLSDPDEIEAPMTPGQAAHYLRQLNWIGAGYALAGLALFGSYIWATW